MLTDYLLFILKAKTIDQIDSPLIISLCTDIIHRLSSTERMHVYSYKNHVDSIQSFFNKSQIIVLHQNEQIETHTEIIANQCKDLVLVIVERNLSSLGLLENRLSEDFNLRLCFYYFSIITHDSRILEPIRMNILPFRSRWKIGIFR